MNNILQDVRYALRMLWKSPGVSLVAILALTAGIGANTAIFSVVNAVLLRPLPYAQPERLVNIWSVRVGGELERSSISYADFEDWRRQSKTFEQIAAWTYNGSFLRTSADPIPLDGIEASYGLMPALGIKPELGRMIAADDDRAGAAPVIVISHAVWVKDFGQRSDVIGSSATFGSTTRTIVGVMPSSFVFPATWSRTDFVIPIEPSLAPQMRQRGNQSLKCVGFLRPHATLQDARAELGGMSEQLATAYPDSNSSRTTWLVGMQDDIVGDVKPALLIMLGAVGFVLLIACANVANLLFARATSRQRELSIRAALGASRGRIVRQLLVESLILSIAGAGAGLLFASWGIDALLKFSPGTVPRLYTAGLDPVVLTFTLVVAVVTTLVAGIAPAIAMSRPEVVDALKDGSRGSTEGAGPRRTRSVLVAVQFALSVMLLVGAGLLIRSFLELQGVNPGFDANGVYALALNPSSHTYPKPEDERRYFKQVVDAVRAAPGVDEAALIAPRPFSGWERSSSFTIEGQPLPAPGDEPVGDFRSTSPGYFETLRIPIVQGRDFTEKDTKESPLVVIVNQSFARKFFSDAEPIGQRIVIGADADNPNPPPCEIVGIVGDAYHESLDVKPGPEYYVPLTQIDESRVDVVVRGAGVTALGLRDVVRSVDRGEYIAAPERLDAQVSESVDRYRFNTLLLGLFAAVALLLATVGIYGVMAYGVTRRTHEIGIRMALGASAGLILRQVIGQGLVMALVGTGIGLVGAFVLSRTLESLLFGVTATDLTTFSIVTGVLLFVAFAACYIPARWAARVDPMIALRSE